MSKITLLFTFCFLFGLGALLAQTEGNDNGNGNSNSNNVNISFPQFVTINITTTNSPDVNFTLNSDGLEAGDEFIIDEENSDLWINYTSVINGAGSTRSITVESSSIPSLPGLTLQVIASDHIGNGGGQVGSSTSIVTPSSLPTDVISGIGSTFTGSGNSNGHNLTYYLDYTGDFGALTVEDVSQVISMAYTISD